MWSFTQQKRKSSHQEHGSQLKHFLNNNKTHPSTLIDPLMKIYLTTCMSCCGVASSVIMPCHPQSLFQIYILFNYLFPTLCSSHFQMSFWIQYIYTGIYIFTYVTLSCGDQETLAPKTYWLNKTEYSVRKPNNSPIVEKQKVLYHCSYFLFLTHHGHVILQ